MYDVQVRLVDSSENNLTYAYKGRVEVLYRDQWGTICSDQWTLSGAHVVCRYRQYLIINQLLSQIKILNTHDDIVYAARIFIMR